MGEPHLDALALTARLLEGIGASERSSDITSVLVDAARDPALRCFWTAAGFEIALCTIRHTAAIEDRISSIDPVRGRQGLARGASIGVGARLVPEIGAREGPVLALGLVDDRDVRRDLLLLDEPAQH